MDRDDKKFIDHERKASEDLRVKRCPSHTKVTVENPRKRREIFIIVLLWKETQGTWAVEERERKSL